MSWLPCIRCGGDRWWLPLSRQSADVLAAMLLDAAEQPRYLAALIDQLRVDPALLIFAALASGSSLTSPPRELTIAALAQSLRADLMSLFCGGEAALGAPPSFDPGGGDAEQTAWIATWEQLRSRFMQLPHSQWLSAAAQWLELTGPRVPVAWRQTWPSVIGDGDQRSGTHSAPISYAPSQVDLAALARTVRRGRTLEDAFLDSLQQAKRAALKQFAYGLSHEINNPLANISTRAQTLLRGESDPNRSKSLQRIIDQTMRAHEMVADLMFYAHPPSLQQGCVDLHNVLQTVLKQSLEAVEGRAIELSLSPSAQRVTLLGDRNMLVEAVRGLVRNAIEAVGCDGKVQLSCEQQSLGPPNAPPDPSRLAAVITICDSGPGLSEAARQHAFDPYFSGREAGRGLGVGLCRVERIAQLHGGGVSLHSGPAGCTARLWIPLAT